ncbi:MAG: futalosine hydrolase [Ferruginibacter sp.]|nr:futalosine hydrolase [Ferruginibacter sp.]
MDILLAAATKFEIQPTLQLLEKEGFIINGHNIDILITGVGMVSTTYNLTTKLIGKKYGFIIQAGIAGTFSNDLLLCETVLVKQDAFGDIGMEEKGNFTTVFDAGFAGKNDFPFTDGWLVNNNTILTTSLLKKVSAITVNKVSDSLLQRQQATQYFGPQVESMEGAAFHYVCLQQKLNFIQLRSISNAVGDRDKSKWRIKDAIVNLNTELEKLLLQL